MLSFYPASGFGFKFNCINSWAFHSNYKWNWSRNRRNTVFPTILKQVGAMSCQF